MIITCAAHCGKAHPVGGSRVGPTCNDRYKIRSSRSISRCGWIDT